MPIYALKRMANVRHSALIQVHKYAASIGFPILHLITVQITSLTATSYKKSRVDKGEVDLYR